MTHHLTNIEKSDQVAEWVVEAARISGQDVRYVDEPMPVDADSMDGSDYYAAHRQGMIQTHGCIVGHEDVRDYSLFWAAYDKLEASSVCSNTREGA